MEYDLKLKLKKFRIIHCPIDEYNMDKKLLEKIKNKT